MLSLFQHAQQTPLEDLPSGGDQLRFNLGRTALRLTLGLGFRLFLLALGLAARLVLQLLLAAACFIVQLLLALARLVLQLLLPLLVGFFLFQTLFFRLGLRLLTALRSASSCLAVSAFSASSVSTS